jgi:hypothetical protein
VRLAKNALNYIVQQRGKMLVREGVLVREVWCGEAVTLLKAYASRMASSDLRNF